MGQQVFLPKYHIEECLDAVRDCLEKGWTGLGYKTVEFEEAWKEYTGHGNAHFLNSNTAGLYLAVEILKKKYGWDDGDEVISTPITFVSTNHAVLHQNLKVQFADVDECLCLDPIDVEKKINDKTRAIMFVGYGGRFGKLDEIISLCEKHNLRLILDAAHMSGTRVNGVFPGTLNGVDAAVYSFQAVKNLPTADSGMICFADPELDSMCRKYSWLGINKDTYERTSSTGNYKWRYDVDYLGYKYHGNSIMAALALTQLKYLDDDNARRREMVKMYNECFEGNDRILIIPATHEDECSFHIYEIAVDDRDALMSFLAANEVFTGVHYRDNTEYSMYSYAQGTCPQAHEISKHIVTLPLHLGLSDKDVRHIAGLVNDFVAR